MSSRFTADLVLAGLVATLLCGIAVADVTREPFDAKYSLSVGAFFTDHDTNIRLDSISGPGTLVNLENDLGLDSTTDILRVDGVWQFADRHRAHFSIFDLSQEGSRSLEKDLLIDGEPFSINEAVITDWKMRLFEIGYSYRFRGNQKFQWWFNFAVFMQDTSITVEETSAGGAVASEDVVLPLPKLGTMLEYAFTKRWIGRAGLDVLKLEIDDVGGSLVDFRTTLDYRVTENFNLGVGWHLINVAVDLDRSVSGWQGRFDWETRGFLFYGSLAW